MYLYGRWVVGPAPAIGPKSVSSIIHADVIPVLNQSYFTGQSSAVRLHPFSSRFTGSDRKNIIKTHILKKLLVMIYACVVGVSACVRMRACVCVCVCVCEHSYVCVCVLV